MPDDATTQDQIGQPAPEGEPIDLGALALGVIAPPLIWVAILIGLYATATNICYSDIAPRLTRDEPPSTWWILAAIAALGAIICLAGIFVSYRSFRIVAAHAQEHPGGVMVAGEGRTRFIAIWGVLTSTLFSGLVLLTLLAILLVPLCGF